MTEWIRAQSSSGFPDELGPLQLAWLGDSVWELHQRLRNCHSPARSKDLHKAVVLDVRASAQAEAIRYLKPQSVQPYWYSCLLEMLNRCMLPYHDHI